MYNVLEKFRSGEALTAKEKVIHEQGLVSVLKKLHDYLDAAVFDAYGWPHDLTDEQILERLVALNAERAEEEKRGLIRWLRPDFQCKDAQPVPAETGDLDLPEPEAEPEPAPVKPVRKPKAAPAGDKPRWPGTIPEQIAAVRDLLLANRTHWTAESVARAFKHARASSVEPVLDSLTALGLLVSYPGESGKMWRAGR